MAGFFPENKSFMNSVGIFTTALSLNHIMDLDEDMRKYCEVTYLPYTSPEHLKYLYKQNADKFDGLLFSGSYPYEVLQHQYGNFQQPCAYFNITDRDYYKLIARLAIQEPSLDFSRVYFDTPEISVDFQSIFHQNNIPRLGLIPLDLDATDPQDWYQPLKKYYLDLWNQGDIDLLVTRYSSMEEYFREHGIRHLHLAPSRESMKETFHHLVLQMDAAAIRESAVCLGLVSFPQNLSAGQQEHLGTCLQNFNRQAGMPFLIYKRDDRYELTTNTSMLKELSKHYTTCPVITAVENNIDFPVSVGWGASGSVADALRNAQRALREAQQYNTSTSFLVMTNNQIIGPLSSPRCLSYTDAPDSHLIEAGKRLSISPLYLSKILSILNQKEDDTLTAEELAFFLDITTRSASRILSRLEAGGAATVLYNRQINLRGRPAKIYKINLQKNPCTNQ